MTALTIITIVVVALLTVLIFGLTWLGYSSCLKAYKLEIDQGKHDRDILKGKQIKKKKSVGGLLGLISSYVVLSLLFGLFITGIVYKVNGNNFSIDNKTALVIKSGSMSDFYDDKIASYYDNDTSLHFDVGDICIFDKPNEDLTIGDVYGYKYKNIIITHRLVNITEDNLYQFRGDNNPDVDGVLVSKDSILYHYTGKKIPGVGSFILYAQSYFGLWSLIGIIGVTASSEVIYYKIDKLNKKRLEVLENEK